jgi:hypothetical protein
MTDQPADRAASDNARIEEAIAESFPASDAPSWTTGIERHGIASSPALKQHLLLPDRPVQSYVQYLRWVGASAVRRAARSCWRLRQEACRSICCIDIRLGAASLWHCSWTSWRFTIES